MQAKITSKGQSPFAKYRGIGIPGPKHGGRKAILRRIRKLRGR